MGETIANHCGNGVGAWFARGEPHTTIGRISVSKTRGRTRGREDNLNRANFVKQVYGCKNIQFYKANLELLDPGQWDQFDVVFCAGVLYHLPKPWELIRKVSSLCRRLLFVDTHYAHDETALIERYSGRSQDEGNDPLSGLSAKSFWLSFKDLVLLLMENGFPVRFVRDYEVFPKGPRVFIVAERVDAVGCDWSKAQQGVWGIQNTG